MKRLGTMLWMAPLAIAFFASFLYSNVYLPFRGVPPIGIEVRVSNNAVTIWSVAPGSPAANAGVLPGDRARSFNGQPIRELNDYLIPEQLIAQRDRTVITVERSGKQLELELKSK